ncbi:helix-turn-helix domain-containing protein [Lysinibacillus sp. BW-2-10]|uniref:helix-turn-helix domain-containing protein n=1 Tax=Lysinibacillus sp. BW-2-10 TaxID=2590030 RepID=UPI002108480A|nr:helix-turn-helix domain-containing protein [Lysinibacillus sp. BW-2-10]
MKNYVSEVYDVSDLQNILDIGRKQAYQLANSNAFHTIKVGSRIKIPKSTFNQWLTGQQTYSNPSVSNKIEI